MHARLFFHLVKMIQDLENAKYKKSTREHVQQCHTDATARPISRPNQTFVAFFHLPLNDVVFDRVWESVSKPATVYPSVYF